jgi:two-component system cell cycle sensor histidine kinase/response regulator CckA
VEVRNAAEALARWQREGDTIDVVLSDVVMPGMSGAELAGRLAAMRPETRIVLMSGFTHVGSTQRLLQPSGARFLAKPFTPSQLLRTIRDAADAAAR